MAGLSLLIGAGRMENESFTHVMDIEMRPVAVLEIVKRMNWP